MDEDRIRDRAYAIWEREGWPDGRHEAHWEQARQELEDEARRERDTPRFPSSEALGSEDLVSDDLLHPSGRNGGSLRPAAEAMGGLEERPVERGRSPAPGGPDEAGGT